MTVAIKYSEIKDVFVSNPVSLINNNISTIKVLKISAESAIFSFKLSDDNVTFSSDLYLTRDIAPNETVTIYIKADSTQVDRIITKNLINLKVEYV